MCICEHIDISYQCFLIASLYVTVYVASIQNWRIALIFFKKDEARDLLTSITMSGILQLSIIGGLYGFLAILCAMKAV